VLFMRMKGAINAWDGIERSGRTRPEGKCFQRGQAYLDLLSVFLSAGGGAWNLLTITGGRFVGYIQVNGGIRLWGGGGCETPMEKCR